MNKQFERYLQITLSMLDLCLLNLAYLLCYFVLSEKIPSEFLYSYAAYWLTSNGIWIVLCFFFGTYSGNIIVNFEHFTQRTIKVYIFWLVLLLFYLFFARVILISRIFIISTIISFGIGLLISRFLYLGIRNYYKNNERIIKKVIILGYNNTAKKLATYFEDNGINTQMIGFIENTENVHELSHYPVLSEISNTLTIAKDLGIHEIFSTITPEQNKDVYDLMYQAEKECIRFKIVPDLSVFIRREVHIEYMGDLPILSLRSEPLDDVGNRIKKRMLDLLVSSFVIVFILSWLVPIIGLLIVLDSRGPIFFKQLRTGKNNKTFKCLKFRSMKFNKESDLKQATQNDKRLTRIGKFIRKTSIDEFPQFINVFKGEMSLVGPRPHMLKHTSDYSKIVDEYMIRQFLKPGITGWAQTNGYRGEITSEEQLQMRIQKDIWYLENWTLLLDIQILFSTIYLLFKGDKMAY
jgi:putative colanic acid biosynthesis UDP-glucose lipid carrier transferase